MTVRERVPAGESDGVDLSATLELLASLTEYAEAGAVQPHTLAQAAQHALEEHGDHVEVLLAVAKLHLATGYREAAARVLGRAARLFPGDGRVEQLQGEAGLDTTRRAPLSVGALGLSEPQSGARPADEQPYDTSIRRRSDLGDDGPESARTPVSLRGRPEPSGQRSRPVKVAVEEPPARVAEPTPATPRSTGSPTQRPTVKMARVAGAPERRWGKGDGREPLDSRPAFDSRPDRESSAPSSYGPRSVRFPPSQRGVSIRDAAATPASPMPRVHRDGPRTGRAATGNLKLLDPTDERRRLDRYELIGEIASGGMASVFLARIAGVAGFQRFYAIKRLHPHLADEQEFIDMFLDEARLAAGIHHPNVVPILEVGTSEAGYYLVMDYIEGDTLSGVIARAATVTGELPRPIALRILLDSLQGLHAAHELTDADGRLVDLVHRDCSPQNILVGVDGTSRLTDFGVARASSRLSTTRTATVKGKLAYLSPEQATGRPLDRRSDLFGMGVILWEVLAGRRLFRADSEGATLSRILVEPIPYLSDHAPDVPEVVSEVVARALARSPDDRFATAADVADALEQAVRAVETPELFIASPRDVGAYMRELFGPDIGARRDAIRAWSAACSEPDDGPRSYGLHRGAGSPSPPGARGREPSLPDSAPVSEAGVDSEVPSTKKEASLLREEEAAASKAASPKAGATPPSSEDADPGAKPDPTPTPTVPSAIEVAPEPPAPAQAAAPAKPSARRPPVALIALTLLLILAAVAMFAVRSLR